MAERVLNCKDVSEGEVGDRFTLAICGNGMIQDIEGFNGGGEAFVDNGVEVGVICMEDGYGAFIKGVWLVN